MGQDNCISAWGLVILCKYRPGNSWRYGRELRIQDDDEKWDELVVNGIYILLTCYTDKKRRLRRSWLHSRRIEVSRDINLHIYRLSTNFWYCFKNVYAVFCKLFLRVSNTLPPPPPKLAYKCGDIACRNVFGRWIGRGCQTFWHDIGFPPVAACTGLC
jgi:hypothetical protein